ncbi:nuclear transport factor 2 family protein [[Mycobacterium] crassicus]|uniref:Nuclear transport factor 2 family protein n=1 Tax=[Mycobacterium] crassicus TaxID=2872309 RepID=A0ABU5XD08_9MYCO|nr:nuclear transport factor 2 family protein [Mycolicibacter sp. MYC098]MEB3020164.1 nuclear transport factor 2 family protein [Mycolicibacter sp. MYC098]
MATPFDDPQAELAWMFLQGICGDDDLDEIFALVSDDFTYWSILTGQALDKDAVRRQTEDRRPGLRISLDLLRCINEHETVVIEAQGDCVTTDGGHYASPLVFIVDCHDGRIVSVREYTDTRFAAEVLGL